MKKRSISLILALILCLSLLPAAALAAEPVSYLDENGVQQTCTSYKQASELTTGTVAGGPSYEVTGWTEGWYVADGTVTIDQMIWIFDEVHLILKDGCTLTINGIRGGGDLHIYAQSTGESAGKLSSTGQGEQWVPVTEEVSKPVNSFCGIWANTLTVNGGQITATGSSEAGCTYSVGIMVGGLTLNGGSVTAKGCDLTVTDDTETDTVSGISTGLEFSELTVNAGSLTCIGGTVQVTAKSRVIKGESEGMYGDDYPDENETVTINGGTVRATGGAVTVTRNGTASDEDVTIALSYGACLNHVQVNKNGGRIVCTSGTVSSNCTTGDTVIESKDSDVEGISDAEDPLAWLLPVIGALDKEPFDDVKSGDWFYDDVRFVNEYGLMTGTGSRTFSPDAPVTRGMVMTILARREGIMTDRYSPWYAAGVEWAVANGISDGSNPEAEITREELATMLYRYAKLKGYDLSGVVLTGYTDASSVSGYAVSAMQWAVGSGLMNGSNGKLTPRDTATRAQLAAMLHRFFG